ncbi:MAG: NAD(+) diphosphatase [Anaerovoracaceae bacterium]
MIQDIEPRTFCNDYEPGEAAADDKVCCFRTGEVLMREAVADSRLPLVAELRSAGLSEGDLQYLFRIDDERYYLYRGGSEPELEGYSYQKVRFAWAGGEKSEGFAVMTAYHLYVWYSKTQFCGRCGAGMQTGTDERVMRCPVCGNVAYPMIAPAVIVGVTDGDRIIVTRYAGREYKGVALIAGFCEIGESAEATVKREVMEEVGLHVKNIRYFDSQPWGVDSNLLLGYFCEVDGERHLNIDHEELAAGRWLSREELPEQENLSSLTATMIEFFRRQK